MYSQGSAGLDCWIFQSGLQSSLVDRIAIDTPKSKSDFGFGLSIHFEKWIWIWLQLRN